MGVADIVDLVAKGEGWPANEEAASTASRSRALSTALAYARLFATRDFEANSEGLSASVTADSVQKNDQVNSQNNIEKAPEPAPMSKNDACEDADGKDGDANSTCVHIVGADFVEANDQATQVFEEFSRWLKATQGIDKLNVVLVGPNVPLALDGSEMIDKELGISVYMRSCTYEEMLEAKDKDVPKAVLAMLFNAGIWGYDSWAATLCTLMDLAVPTVVTSYNGWEAEDDQDSIEEALEGKAVEWLWEPEQNPFGSNIHRPAGVENRTCADNAFWQCFRPKQLQKVNLK